MDQNSSRRQFFTHVASLVGMAVIAPTLFGASAFAEERRRARTEGGAAPAAGAGGDTNLPLVEPGKGMAASVNYATNHANVKDAALKVERSGVAFDKQHCMNCGFYTKAGNKNGKEVGKCTLFNGQLVESTAWCSTWNKKA